MAYAEGTSVSPEKSRMEIETTLRRYGANAFGYVSDDARSAVQFSFKGRSIRILIAKADASKLQRSYYGRLRAATPAEKEKWQYDESRRQWRALLLVIKAKLEAVESKIATFDDEFMAYVVMPNGQTMGEWMRPQLDEAIKNGRMPQLLLGGNP